MKPCVISLVAGLGFLMQALAEVSPLDPISPDTSIHMPTIPPKEVCNDGIDNDLDGKIDYEDPDCAPSGKIYFVSSSSGDDSWDGESPVWTGGINGPKASADAIAALLDGAGPGDAILLQRGDAWMLTEILEISTAAGTASEPIILGAYGSGSEPELIHDTPGTETWTLNVRGGYGTTPPSQHLIIENLRLSTTHDGNKGFVVMENVRDTKPHDITIRRCLIEDNDHGITITDNLDANLCNVTVEDCIIRNNGIPSSAWEERSMGLYCAANNLTVRGNTFDNNGSTIGSAYSWNIYVQCRSGVTIEDNTFSNSYTGVKVGRMQGVLIRGNTFVDLKTVAMTVGGDEGGPTTDVTIEQNRVYNCGDGLVIKEQNEAGKGSTENLVIRNNLFYQNDTAAPDDNEYYVYLRGTIPIIDAFVYNNLFYGIVGENDLLIGSNAGSNVKVRNNIFWKTDTSKAAFVDYLGADSGFNLFCVNSTASLSYGTDDIIASPADLEFIDPSSGDFMPASGGALVIDQGDDAAGIVDDDFDGFARPIGPKWDIGPFEFEETDLAISVEIAGPYETKSYWKKTAVGSLARQYYRRLTYNVTFQNVHATVRSPAAVFEVEYDDMWSGAKVHKVVGYVPELDPGKSHQTTYSIDVPVSSAGLITSAVNVSFTVSGIPDGDWSNNSVDLILNTAYFQPDYRVQLSALTIVDNSVTIGAKVKNVGPEPGTAWTRTAFYVNATKASEILTQPLSVAQEKEVSFSCVLALIGDDEPGSYTLEIRADSLGRITESNEKNNSDSVVISKKTATLLRDYLDLDDSLRGELIDLCDLIAKDIAKAMDFLKYLIDDIPGESFFEKYATGRFLPKYTYDAASELLVMTDPEALKPVLVSIRP